MTSSSFPSPGLSAVDHAGTTHGWQWYAARVAIGLFVVALLGSLWVLHRQDLEENRSSLIRDVLWVEQNLQFSLERDVEHFRQLAMGLSETGLDPGQFEVRVKHVLASSPGLEEVALLDDRGGLLATAPVPIEASALWSGDGSRAAFRLARSTGKPAYAPPHRSTGDFRFEVFVPYYREGALAGAVVGVYGLKGILNGLVPWWLAE
jgi:two-component system, LuxR family, sensor histidine kinase DctS